MSNRLDEVLVQKITKVAEGFGLSQSAEKALLAAAEVNTDSAYATVPGITDDVTAASQMAVKLSYVEAFKLVYLVSLAFGGLAIIAAFSTRSTDSKRKTNERAVVLKNEATALEDSDKSVGANN